IGTSVGIAWTVWRLVPLAVRRTTAAGAVAAGAFDDFQDAAILVLRTPTLIWIFLGGALVTFAVNGLVAGAAAVMQRLHGLALAPPLIGYLSDRTGDLRTAMLLLPAVGLLGGLVILIALQTVARDMRRVTALDIHVSGQG